MDTNGADVPALAPVDDDRSVALPAIDLDRLAGLVDELERDIALIDGAMTHVEMREFGAAAAALDVLDGVSSA